MNKFLNKEESGKFSEYLKKHNLHDNAKLAKIFYVSPSTMSVNLPKFQRKVQRKSSGRVPRLWKDVIELRVYSEELKKKVGKIEELMKKD